MSYDPETQTFLDSLEPPQPPQPAPQTPTAPNPRLEPGAGSTGPYRLPMPPQPGGEGYTMPSNLPALSPSELSEHMGRLAALIAYASVRAAEAENAIAYQRYTLELYRAGLYLRLRESAGKPTEKQLEALVTTDRDTRDYALTLMQLEAEARMIRALLSGYQTQLNALSRELSRRQAEWDAARGLK